MTLTGPSRTIVVEPLQAPVTAPAPPRRADPPPPPSTEPAPATPETEPARA